MGELPSDHDVLTRVVVQLEHVIESVDTLSSKLEASQTRTESAIDKLRAEVQRSIEAARPQCPSARCAEHDELIGELQQKVEDLRDEMAKERAKKDLIKYAFEALAVSGFGLGLVTLLLLVLGVD
ncbi:MAG: hypothetical protein WCK39_07125 [Methanomassiliicoccales archaeon]